MKTSKITTRGLSRIANNLSSEITKELSIHTWHDNPEFTVKVDNGATGGKSVIVSPSEDNVLSTSFCHVNLEEIQKVVQKYTKKYGDDIYYTIEVEPRIRYDRNNDLYWIHVPVVAIYVNVSKTEE